MTLLRFPRYAMGETVLGKPVGKGALSPMSLSIELRTEFITLGQLVKYLGLVDSGAEVKTFLAETPILVNGEPDNRRGRKLYPGDSVTFDGEEAVRITGGGPIRPPTEGGETAE
jgi:ribosome-associated protein